MSVTTCLRRTMFTLLVIWLGLWSGLAGYWFTDARLPGVILSTEAVRFDVPQGKLLAVRWVAERKHYCETTRNDYIIDSTGVRTTIPSQIFPRQPGPLGRDMFVTLTPVPSWLPLGPAVLRTQLVYVCNPVQRYITEGLVDSVETHFNVVAKDY